MSNDAMQVSPPLPLQMRERFRGYPEHIAELEGALEAVAKEPRGTFDYFERAIWSLEARLEGFASRARDALAVAERKGDVEEIARAKGELLYMLHSLNPVYYNLDELSRYFETPEAPASLVAKLNSPTRNEGAMTQSIDQARLRAAAEHLDWVLSCYPDHEGIRNLREVLASLIERAKAGLITEPQDRRDFPAGWALAEGLYADLKDPSVDDALIEFSIELRGGLTEREKRLIAKLEARWHSGDPA